MRRVVFIVIVLVLSIFLHNCTEKAETLGNLKAKGEKEFMDGNYKSARTYYLKGLAKKPSDFDLLYYTAISYHREYIYDSALIYYKKADLLYPSNFELNQAILQVAPEVEDWDNAIKAIRFLVKSGENQEIYLKRLVDYHQKLGHNLHTYNYLKKLMKIEPDVFDYYLRSISATLNINSLYVAELLLDTAFEKFGEKPELKANQGVLFLSSSEFLKAENVFRKLLFEFDNNIYYKLNLATTLGEQDSKKKKLEAIDLYREIAPSLGEQFPVDSIVEVLLKDINK